MDSQSGASVAPKRDQAFHQRRWGESTVWGRLSSAPLIRFACKVVGFNFAERVDYTLSRLKPRPHDETFGHRNHLLLGLNIVSLGAVEWSACSRGTPWLSLLFPEVISRQTA